MQNCGTSESLFKTICVYGLTESAAAERLGDFKNTFPALELGIQAELPIIKIRLSGGDADEDRLKSLLENAGLWICRKMGDHVFSESGQEIEEVVGSQLQQNNATLAVAESCTGGLIASMLTDVPGSSEYFLFSAVTYSNPAKVKILNVNPHTLEKHGAVSEQTAGEMAAGARKSVDATYGLATSGIAGPGGGSEDKPVGTVCIGLATPSAVNAQRFFLPAVDRKMNKHFFAIAALNLLRTELICT